MRIQPRAFLLLRGRGSGRLRGLRWLPGAGGITDGEDPCPNSAGDKANGGRGDSDGDGVPDGQDLCPFMAGPKGYDGCPDADGDEVPDNVDKCPVDFRLIKSEVETPARTVPAEKQGVADEKHTGKR